MRNLCFAVALALAGWSTTAAQDAKSVDPPKEPEKKAPGQSLDEMLLFFPSKHPAGNWKPAGLAFEDAWFNAADGTKLHGWYLPCDKPRAVVLYAHGNGGNLSHRAARLKFLQKELRVAVLAFDYRGYGRSEGTPTVQGVLQDARAARSWLEKHVKIEESQIVLIGQSLGGAIVADLAGRDGARALVLESTFSSMRDVAAIHYSNLACIVPTDKLNSVACVSKYKGPLLQCHGDADRTIPFNLAEKLHAAAAGPKHFVRMPGRDHNDPQTADYLKRLDKFVDELR